VLVYEKDDLVLLVPFAEGCATARGVRSRAPAAWRYWRRCGRLRAG
jgi:hypothetical protein